MSWLSEEIKGVIEWAFGWLGDGLLAVVRQLLRTLTIPIVGTPGPRGEDGRIAFGTPTNPPWPALYEEVYLPFILPLALGLLFLALAYFGVRAGAISAYRRRRLTRRFVIALGAVFFWFPIASAGTQFFNAVGLAIATGDGGPGLLVATLGDALTVSIGGVILVLVIYAVESALVVFAALVFAARWLAVIVLTLTMPLLAALWVFEIWPLDRFGGVASQIAALYPGLLAAGLPSAVMLRIAVEAEFRFGFEGLFAVLLSAMLIPGAAVASLLTILWSRRGIRRSARRAAVATTATAAGTPAAARGVKQRANQTLRGARNVHRGVAGRPPLTGGSDTTRTGGSSSTTQVGAVKLRPPARSAMGSRKTPIGHRLDVGEVTGTHQSSGTGQGRDQASGEANETPSAWATGRKARRAVRKTKRKLSRW